MNQVLSHLEFTFHDMKHVLKCLFTIMIHDKQPQGLLFIS